MSDGEQLPVVRSPSADDDDVGRTFTVEQQRALYWRLSTGGTHQGEAAEHAGVTRRTVERWLARLDFRSAWNDPEGWARTYVLKQRAGLELRSLSKLHELLANPKVAPGIHVEIATKALQDIRQTRATESDAQVGRALLEEFEAWRRRSEELLSTSESEPPSKDTAPTAPGTGIPPAREIYHD